MYLFFALICFHCLCTIYYAYQIFKIIYFHPLQLKYKENYEKTKGQLIGVKGVNEDSQMAHSFHVSKLQSDLEYKRTFENVKNQYHVSMDMINLVHAKKAQDLATDRGYKTIMHRYTALPTDMKVEWAKWAYGLQSDVSSTLDNLHLPFFRKAKNYFLA